MKKRTTRRGGESGEEESYAEKTLHVLKDIAPALAGSLTGLPIPALVETLSGIFGTKEGEKELHEQDIYHRVRKKQLSEEEYAKIREKEMELHLEKMREENKRLSLQIEEIKDAREREIKKGDNFSRLLATIIFTGFFGMVFCFAYFPVESDREVYAEVVRFLGDCIICVSAYYFGSSFGGFGRKNEGSNNLGGVASCVGALHLFKRLRDSRERKVENREDREKRETKRGD